MTYLAKIHNIALIVAATLLLQGCSTKPELKFSEYGFFTPLPKEERVIDVVKVTWLVEKNAAQICKTIMEKSQEALGGERAYITPPIACAIWYKAKKTCTIITSQVVSHTILGHELRHCFEGHFH